MKAPPRRGPTTDAIPYAAPRRPSIIGSWCGGLENLMMMNAPETKPARPTPTTARPAMKVGLFWATPVQDTSSAVGHGYHLEKGD